MKINQTTLNQPILDRFDKELRAILVHDLNQFHQAKGQFLRNSRNINPAEKSRLVA